MLLATTRRLGCPCHSFSSRRVGPGDADSRDVRGCASKWRMYEPVNLAGLPVGALPLPQTCWTGGVICAGSLECLRHPRYPFGQPSNQICSGDEPMTKAMTLEQ